MILYALQAKDNCGKSTTLKRLLLKFLQEGRAITPVDKVALAKELEEEKRAEMSDAEYETADCIAIADVCGVRVGVASDGSTPEITMDALQAFEEGGCDVGFCAVRSKGAVQAFLERFARTNTVYKIEKAVLLNAEYFPEAKEYTENLNNWQTESLYAYFKSEAENFKRR